ncbi:tRNA threonylcarbamoyladenosine biosynthesis protein RimN [Ketobacter sp. MCCC 1A13808]|uniref:Sua5/YciO/YrdC/YwlC family protein n=1 Tax=Ketobacter sp. MCCC 1A13808 TaxID=2602738 RepID=UPI0012EB2441|nr:Sua5/YciO/YrdC/YwlC family protein [Ketobacter sp. MCCC 1A13808]MVF14288.1 tRNA threonylcarbamoyladenosine biosynthesis protein RimN [Ketobacter sp. MCCC 1A13808]
MLALRHRLGAVNALAQGEVIAYPTESVFGYGCDPFNPIAVQRLLTLKQRPVEKGLILVAANCQQIEPLLRSLSADQRHRLDADWPGPVTWLIPDPEQLIPAWIKGSFSSVAVRVSAHPLVQSLCQAWGGPIVSSSANQSGRPPAKSEYSLLRARRQTGIGADYIVPGATQRRSKPSEIKDLQSGRIIRAA